MRLCSVHRWCELTQSADGAAVGLVAQSVCAGIAETQVSARQDECVPHIRQTHHTLSAVVADLIVGNLEIKGGTISSPWFIFYQTVTSHLKPSQRRGEKNTLVPSDVYLWFLAVVFVLNPIDLLQQITHSIHLRKKNTGKNKGGGGLMWRASCSRGKSSFGVSLSFKMLHKRRKEEREEQAGVLTTCFCFRGFTQ